MSKVIKDKLERIFRECDTHQARMVSAYQNIQAQLPLSPESYKQLNEDNIAYIDQFLFRYAKLQDAMGQRLFKAMLVYFQEDVEALPFLDILNKLEKLEFIASAEKWQALREIRNVIAHEYDDSPELAAQAMNAIFASHQDLIDIYLGLKNVYDKRKDAHV
jgi:hypothetical protein